MGQLGTIKLQTDSGIAVLPVFDIGDSGGSTLEALRVQTDSGEGFVPLVDPADAVTPQEAIRVQTDSGIKAVTVTDSLRSIPSSVIHRYDARRLTVGDGTSSFVWPDLVGSDDLTALGGPTYQDATLNGYPSVLYDGSDDAHEASFSTSVTQPDFIVAVFQVEGTGTNPAERIWSSSDISERQLFGVDSNSASDAFFIFAGASSGLGPDFDKNPHLGGVLYEGSNSELRYDGTVFAAGNIGVNDLPGLRLGSDPDDRSFGNVRVGEVWVMDSPTTSEISTAESILSDDWDITI
jgi:hypothetical protein